MALHVIGRHVVGLCVGRQGVGRRLVKMRVHGRLVVVGMVRVRWVCGGVGSHYIYKKIIEIWEWR